MRACSLSRSSGSSAMVSRYAPKKFVSRAAWIASKSGSAPATPKSEPMPALFTSTSSAPGSSRTAAAARSIDAGSDTSSWSGRPPIASAASRAFASSRAATITS